MFSKRERWGMWKQKFKNRKEIRHKNKAAKGIKKIREEKDKERPFWRT